jgi:hypothetical protein
MASVRKRLFPIVMLCGLLLVSCGGTATEEGGEADVNAILTAGVGTLAASIFETQTALAPTSTETSLPSTATTTNTALPLPSPAPSSTQGLVFVPALSTGSPTPTGTLFTPTPNPSTLGSGCNNLLLISDVSIPAGTVVKPSEPFTKTWKVQNNGTCDWALQFRLVFAGGEPNGRQPQRVGEGDRSAKMDSTLCRAGRPEKARRVYRIMATLHPNRDRVWIDAHCLHCGCRADQHASPADEYTASHFDIYSGAADIHVHRDPDSANGNNHANDGSASIV